MQNQLLQSEQQNALSLFSLTDEKIGIFMQHYRFISGIIILHWLYDNHESSNNI